MVGFGGSQGECERRMGVFVKIQRENISEVVRLGGSGWM